LKADPTNKKWSEFPVELCGGTHLANSKEADLFAIVKEEQKSQGVRRVVAVTGEAATAAFQLAATLSQELDSILKMTDEKLKHHKLVAFNADLNTAKIPVWKKLELRELLAPILKSGTDNAIKAAKDSKSSAEDHATKVAAELKASSAAVWVEHFDVGGSQEALANAAKAIVEGAGKPVGVALVSVDPKPGKERLMVATFVAKELVPKLPANDWAKAIAQAVNSKDGKGGGKPNVAQGGSPYKSPEDVEKALKAGKEFAAGKV